MRVLIVHPKMTFYGGAELLVVRLANYLTRQGVANAVLTTVMAPEIEQDFKGTRLIYPTAMRQETIRFTNFPRIVLCLHQALSRHVDHYDVINPHNFPANLALFLLNRPCVWMCNEPPEIALDFEQAGPGTPRRFFLRLLIAWDRQVVRKYVRNAVVADGFNRDRFEKIYGFKPSVIHYGIDHEFFADGPSQRTEKRSDTFNVLHVGVLTRFKNQMESVTTVQKLKRVIPNIRLVLAGLGTGSYLACLRDYINEKGLEDNVHITGHLNRYQLRDLYHSCDVLLHPIKPQGGWLSPFEALSARLPIVVSSEMTASELISKNNLGVVTRDYASALLEIYRDREEHARRAEERAQWVKDHLTWDHFCQKMLESFERAVSLGASISAGGPRIP
jgi:glycosyltransferase involved in cell wall biosynthesis